MFLNVLIVGGGLTGILLSQALWEYSIPHKIVDNSLSHRGTAASSGILNPVMGRRRQVVPDYENLLPPALKAYTNLEAQLQTPLLYSAEIIDLHRSAEEAQFFTQRSTELPKFLQPKTLIGAAQRLDTGWGATATEGGFLLNLQKLVLHVKAQMEKQHLWIAESFRYDAVTPNAGKLDYAGEGFSHIILCNGIQALETPIFQKLPLSANKGQALILQTDAALPPHTIYKWGKELSLVPVGEGRYWAGASYEWNYEHPFPTTGYLQQLEASISRYFPYPFRVLKSVSGLRTSVLDRRPIVGFHPQYPQWGVVNGMGTKGVLQAPACVYEMAQILNTGSANANTHSINRFQRILQ